VPSSSPDRPITPFIGVRISWLIEARNCDLSRAVSTAWSRACARACSVCRRALMSRANAWKLDGPSLRMRHMVSSIGSSVASARTAAISVGRSSSQSQRPCSTRSSAAP
jgi:hypothetical protein